jgi:hypothetical protein
VLGELRPISVSEMKYIAEKAHTLRLDIGVDENLVANECCKMQSD